MAASSRREPGFCEWLVNVLDNERCPENAYWLDKDKRVFAVRWVHASSAAWSPKCAELFKLWKTEGSRGRGKSDAPIIYRDLKTNFRMNLRSDRFCEQTDVRRIGDDPVRCYKVVETVRKRSRQGARQGNSKKEARQKTPYHTATSERTFPRNGFRGTNFENHLTGTDVTFHQTAGQKYQIDNEQFDIKYQNSCRYTQPWVTTQQELMTQDIYTQQESARPPFHHAPQNSNEDTSRLQPGWTNFDRGQQQVFQHHSNLDGITGLPNKQPDTSGYQYNTFIIPGDMASGFFPEDPTSDDMTILELLTGGTSSPYDSENFFGSSCVLSSGTQNYEKVVQPSRPSLSWSNDSGIEEDKDLCLSWGMNDVEQFTVKQTDEEEYQFTHI